jgi:16S rRNA (guanine1207-N2)-methyltransferase
MPAWAAKDGIIPGTWQSFRVEARGEVLDLETQPGVFAGNRVDGGTALLLQHLGVPPGARVLDVGCGAGVIGIIAHRFGASHVDLVDANLLAIATAARNLERLSIPGRALASDTYDAVRGERYDLIVSNPPFHRGKEVDTSVADRLIDEAPAHLRPGGSLVIVANAFLAYGKRMARVFHHVETVAATRQYHVLLAKDPRGR